MGYVLPAQITGALCGPSTDSPDVGSPHLQEIRSPVSVSREGESRFDAGPPLTLSLPSVTDQVVVTGCSRTRNGQCQCRPGTYCDSVDCVEKCYRCTRYQRWGSRGPPGPGLGSPRLHSCSCRLPGSSAARPVIGAHGSTSRMGRRIKRTTGRFCPEAGLSPCSVTPGPRIRSSCG